MNSAARAADRVRQPLFPTRIGNFIGRFRKDIILEPEALIKSAEDATRLSDWGEDEFQEALEAFCRAINQDRHMHYVGRWITKKTVEENLCDRLQIQKTLTDNPRIIARPVARPILIPGLPRAGTTLLHRLLSLDPQFRTTQLWELNHPVPPPAPETYASDPRIAETAKMYRWLFKMSPALQAAHPTAPTQPEECFFLLDRSFIKIVASLYYDIPTYRDWLLSRTEEQLAGVYRYHKKQLQILQWHFTGRRWLLKSPVHAVMLDAFERVYPDACYIFCHRAPERILPSLCSLTAALKKTFYGRFEPGGIGEMLSGYLMQALDKVLEARERLAPERCFDVAFAQLVKTPMETVEAIYAFLGLSLIREVQTRMLAFLSAQKRSTHLHHTYTLEQFGLSREKIVQAAARYLDRYHMFL